MAPRPNLIPTSHLIHSVYLRGMQDYLLGLNEPQKEAVLHRDGPLMIVAGAGSGKTKVLTTRIAHLMATGVDAFTLLAPTFTIKAAKEMREVFKKLLATSTEGNWNIGHFTRDFDGF